MSRPLRLKLKLQSGMSATPQAKGSSGSQLLPLLASFDVFEISGIQRSVSISERNNRITGLKDTSEAKDLVLDSSKGAREG